MVDYIAEVKKYTENMPPYNPWFFDESRSKPIVCETGYAEAVGIYTEINGSAAKITYQPGTRTPKESHEQVEVFHVLTGSLTIQTWEQRRRKIITLEQYGVFELKPWVRHVITAEVRTTCIAVTMPYSPNFPVANGEATNKPATTAPNFRME